MLTAQIQKPKGIEELLAGYKPAKAEEEKKIDVADAIDFAELLKRYGQWTKDYSYEQPKCINDVLTPEQINALLQATVKYENIKEYQGKIGLLITKLIQNSYEAGHNNFKLDTTALQDMNRIGYQLRGTKENNIEVAIKGDVGYQLGVQAEHATFSVTGNIKSHCGIDANDSTFKATNKEMLQEIREEMRRNNTVIYIHPDGTEEEIKRRRQ